MLVSLVCAVAAVLAACCAAPAAADTAGLLPCTVKFNDTLTFDLSPLHRTSVADGNIHVATRVGDIFLNFCGALLPIKDCPIDGSSNICLVQGGNTFVLTSTSPVSFGDPLDGFEQLFDTHSGLGSCKLDLVVLCGEDELSVESAASDFGCSVSILIFTKYACPAVAMSGSKPETASCLYTASDGTVYDLSALSATHWDYHTSYTDSTTGKQYHFSINPCGPLIGTQHGDCASITSSICQYQGSAGHYNSFVSLGQLTQIDDHAPAAPFLVFDHGTPKADGTTYGTIVQMICDPTAGAGHPEVSEEDTSVYGAIAFRWASTLACHHEDIVYGTGGCMVTDHAGRTWDMSPAIGTYMTTANGTGYRVSICDHLSSDGTAVPRVCNGFGACKTTHDGSTYTSVPLGHATEDVEVDDDELSLTYVDGAPCHGNESYSTVIDFVCDPAEPKGSLHFLAEDGCLAVFEFATALACAPEATAAEPVDCFTTDSDNIRYDLSPLSRTDGKGWTVEGGVDGMFVEVNVCAPVKCGGVNATSALCFEEASSRTPVGKVASPEFKDDVLILDNPPLAPGGVASRITFQCGDPGDLGNPKIVGVVPAGDGLPKTYLFLWRTSAACAEVKVQGTSVCQVSDPVVEYDYDLTSLMGKSHTLSIDATTTMEVSLCGGVTSCSGTRPSGACVRSSNASIPSFSAGAPNTHLEFYQGHIEMEYKSTEVCGSSLYSTVISFSCEPGVSGKDGPTSVQHYSSQPCRYLVNWPTELVCTPSVEVPCTITDLTSTKQYDLSALSKVSSNWQVSEYSRPFNYLLNVCRSLAPTPGVDCPLNAAACQIVKGSPPVTKNIGFPASPQITDDGQIFIEYEDGTTCSNGKNRSTHIDFNCNLESGLGEPRFVGEDACDYFFYWETSAACKITDRPGHNCSVTMPVTEDIYDLSPLKDRLFTVTAEDRGVVYDFELSICSPLPTTSLCRKDHPTTKPVGSCQTSNGTYWWAAGESNEELTVKEGDVTIIYLNGDMCGTNPRSTEVTFTCNRTADHSVGYGQPRFISESTFGCTYYFEWQTSLVCPPFVEAIDCSVTDYTTNKRYDLTPLIDNTANYVVNGDPRFSGKYEYEFNVCRPLVRGTGHQCAARMGVCQKTKDSGSEQDYDLGVPAAPQLDETSNILYIEYDGGDKCSDGTPRHTRINFICALDDDGDPQPGIIGEPKFVGEVDYCSYLFTWRTSYACPLTPSNGTDCAVANPFTGEVFDFRSLRKSGGYGPITDDAGYHYTFNICGTVPCGTNNVGACQKESGVSTGMAATNPVYDGGAITLTYNDGKYCDVAGRNRTTIINFVCSLTETGPESIAEDTSGSDSICVYVINFLTPLACASFDEVPCTVVDPASGATYDLSPLMNMRENYKILPTGSKYEYQINVCRTLLPIQYAPECPLSAAGCQLSETDSTFMAKSLGKPASPQLTADGRLILEYEDGTICDNGSGKARTMRIAFECGSSTTSEPVFESETSTCVYEFSWTTKFACSSLEPTPTPSTPGTCAVLDPATDTLYNLTMLMGQDITFNANTGPFRNTSTEFHLGICSAPTACSALGSNSGVCAATASSGGVPVSRGQVSEQLKLSGTTPTLTYTDGAPCDPSKPDGDKWKTTINFLCDPRQTDTDVRGALSFEFAYATDCAAFINVYTDLVCEAPVFSVDCSTVNDKTGRTYDLSPLARSGTMANWFADEDRETTKSTDRYRYLLNVCRTLTPMQNIESYNECYGAAVCQTKRDDPSFGKNVGGLNDGPSFEEGVLTLRYKAPSWAELCKGVQRTSIITFTCAPGMLGEPEFVAESDYSCEYLFEWATSAACAEERDVGSDCQVRDPITEEFFDLRPLAQGVNYTGTVVHDDYRYELAVCRDVPDTDCGPNTGACQTSLDGKVHYSLGRANSQLTWGDNTLTLQYTGGTKCGSTPRQTTIQFVCGPETKQPEFVDEPSLCDYYFRWETPEACANKEEIDPTFTNPLTGDMYDMSALVRTTDNYDVEETKGKQVDFDYVINAFHTLNRVGKAKNCDEKAAACQIMYGSDRVTPIGQYSIGALVAPPSFDADNNIVLLYENGDSNGCDKGKVRNSKITFKCKKGTADLGAPVFLNETKQCTYEFEWETPAACPLTQTSGTACKATEPTSGKVVDISGLAKKEWTATDAVSGNTYTVSLCGSLSKPCKTIDGDVSDVGACQHANNGQNYALGKGTQDIKLIGDDTVLVSYQGGQICNGASPRTTNIVIECDPCVAAGAEQLEFTGESPGCGYNFYMATQTVCVFAKPCGQPAPTPTPPPGPSPSKKSGGGGGSNTGAIIAVVVVLLVIIAVVGVVGYKKGWFKKVFTRSARYSPMVSDHYNAGNDDDDDDFDLSWD